MQRIDFSKRFSMVKMTILIVFLCCHDTSIMLQARSEIVASSLLQEPSPLPFNEEEEVAEEDDDDNDLPGLMERLEQVRLQPNAKQDDLVFIFKKLVDNSFSIYVPDDVKKDPVDYLHVDLSLHDNDNWDKFDCDDEDKNFFDELQDDQARTLLQEDLNKNGNMFLQEFFNTKAYCAIATNIERFVNFFLQVPYSIQQNFEYGNDMEFYYPHAQENDWNFEYLYDDKKNIIGVKSTLKNSLKITAKRKLFSPFEYLEVRALNIYLHYTYTYFFRQKEERIIEGSKINTVAGKQNSEKSHLTVYSTPGNTFTGLIDFTLTSEEEDTSKSTLLATVGHEFVFYDREKLDVDSDNKYPNTYPTHSSSSTSKEVTNQESTIDGYITQYLSTKDLNVCVAECPSILINKIHFLDHQNW